MWKNTAKACVYALFEPGQPALVQCDSSVSHILSRLPQLSTSVWVTKDRSPAHTSAICSAFLTHLCNSSSFCVRDHSIPQKQFFRRASESWWMLLIMWCLSVAPRSIFQFSDTKWATLSGNGVCRAWKHQKLNSESLCSGRQQRKRRETQMN